MQRW
ncbi:hypothetical protein EC960939_2297, partial [Escherichia coli 96.0939]|jgi:8-oxo-dGTP pyrophosphatase MutT (NUDIX family)